MRTMHKAKHKAGFRSLEGKDLLPDDLMLPQNTGRRARELFNTKRANCAEAVFKAIYEIIDSDLPKEVCSLITSLGGGVAISGITCGAMLAALQAMGLVHGRVKPEQGELYDHRRQLWRTYALYNQLPALFAQKYGSIVCWELTVPYVYGTKECRRRCEDYVEQAAAMAVELLQEAQRHGLPEKFQRNLLEQYAAASGCSSEELIEFKARGKPFPALKK